MKKKRNDSGKSKLMLGIITILCAVLIVLSFTTDMMSGPLRYVTGVITPIQSGMNAIGTWISEKGDYLSTLAPAPDTIFSTSLSEAIDVSPGVVIASAPCATP